MTRAEGSYEKAMKDIGWVSVEKYLPPMGEEVMVLTNEMNGHKLPDASHLCFAHRPDPEVAVCYDGWNIPGVKYWLYCPELPIESNHPKLSDSSLEDEMINYWGRIPDDKDLIDTARHFALWQKEQDRSRKEANIKLANTDVPVDFDMEIAFHDIWEDVEVIIERDGKLDTKLTEDMKALCHDFFESGKEWQKEQMMDEWLKDRDGCFWDGVEEGKKAMEKQMLKEAVEGAIYGCDGLHWIETDADENIKGKEGDKVRIIIVKEDER